VRNVLKQAGILTGRIDEGASRWLDMPSSDCFLFAEDEGLVETCVDLGDELSLGQTIVRIYPIGRTGLAPIEHVAKLDGILVARHFPGLVKAGDCLAVIGTVQGG
jgi:N-alpha-acetyl-L-2,4-diaminobutyrate deacetylase